MEPMTKVCLVSLGCAKNLVDSEQMLALLADAGFELTDDPEAADAAIVNTCAFIDSACEEAVETILSLGKLKTSGKLRKLIVTGCLAERFKDGLLEELPEVDAVLGTGSVQEIVRALRGEETRFFGDINGPIPDADRIISTGPGWAYLKIAEGCSHNCAYCIIPSLRGRYRSRPMEDVLAEAATLAASGVRELIVVAQDPTLYGVDLYKERRLAKLTKALCRIDGVEWVRLHYLYPDAVDDELIDVIAHEPKVLKYLDIPIQHINNGILKAMGRRGTGDEIRALFRKLRERIPGVVLRTSLITGLPGEGEAEFEELCAFLREAKIERAGVFPFSPQEGTRAFTMERPSQETAERRAALIEELQSDIMAAFNESRVGTTERVLCEGFSEETGLYQGRSFAESPDVDGCIWFSAPEATPGEFYDVIIRGELDGELAGELRD